MDPREHLAKIVKAHPALAQEREGEYRLLAVLAALLADVGGVHLEAAILAAQGQDGKGRFKMKRLMPYLGAPPSDESGGDPLQVLGL